MHTVSHIQIENLPFIVGRFQSVIDELLALIKQRTRTVVLACSLHDLAVASENIATQSSYRKIDICTTDGTPLVWLARQREKQAIERVYGADLLESVLRNTQTSNIRHVFCGSTPTTLTRLVHHVSFIAPKAYIAGTFPPQIEMNETAQEATVLKEIIACSPSVLWLGISSPKQVVLAARWKKYFPKTMIICVGAAFDFVSGNKPAAPRWVQLSGLEWLFRLAMEPRRLGKRYLLTIPRFLLHEMIRNITHHSH